MEPTTGPTTQRVPSANYQQVREAIRNKIFRIRTDAERQLNRDTSSYPDEADLDGMSNLELIDIVLWASSFLLQEETWFPNSTSAYEPYYDEDEDPSFVSIGLLPRFDINIAIGKVRRLTILEALDKVSRALRDAGIFFSMDTWRRLTTVKYVPRIIYQARLVRAHELINGLSAEDLETPVGRNLQYRFNHQKSLIEHSLRSMLHGLEVKTEARIVWDHDSGR